MWPQKAIWAKYSEYTLQKAIWAKYSVHICQVGWMSQTSGQKFTVQFGLMQKQETKGGGLRTAVASALLLARNFLNVCEWVCQCRKFVKTANNTQKRHSQICQRSQIVKEIGPLKVELSRICCQTMHAAFGVKTKERFSRLCSAYLAVCCGPHGWKPSRFESPCYRRRGRNPFNPPLSIDAWPRHW